jgi:hypothetical protein
MRANSKILVAKSDATTVTSLTASVDTKGFSFARLIFVSTSNGAITGTNNILEESDDNTTFVTVSGFNAGTDFTAINSTNSTADAKLYFGVDLRGRKRYLKATVTHATGGTGMWIAELSSPANGMNTAAELGAKNIAGNF